MSIRKGTSIIAGNVAQNVDQSLSLVSNNPVKNSAITEELQKKLSTGNITNCLTHIPQDIKLEIDDSKALILKAGSKFYYPKGLSSTTPVFGSFTTTSDLTLNIGAADHTNIPHFICVTSDGTSSVAYASTDVYSSGIAPTAQNALWYDTGNNVIRSTTNGGTTWSSTPLSFPICIAINTAGKCEGIRQTFNGFGYIGSTVFALPGVKALIPNGRNADGTLKNIKVVLDDVETFTDSYKIDGILFFAIKQDKHIGNYFISQLEYRKSENLYYYNGNKPINQMAVFSIYTSKNGGKIETFTPKTVFHAVDYSDTEHIGHQAMPSDRCVNLTLAASGSIYTAPADGYFFWNGDFNANTTGSLRMTVSSQIGSSTQLYAPEGRPCRCFLPIKKGTAVTISYENVYKTYDFRFIYAEGSK